MVFSKVQNFAKKATLASKKNVFSYFDDEESIAITKIKEKESHEKEIQSMRYYGIMKLNRSDTVSMTFTRLTRILLPKVIVLTKIFINKKLVIIR